MATATTSVSLMAWQPMFKPELERSPSAFALLVSPPQNAYEELVRYFVIVGISVYLGCVAYLATITTTNTPEAEDVARHVMRVLRVKPGDIHDRSAGTGYSSAQAHSFRREAMAWLTAQHCFQGPHRLCTAYASQCPARSS
jgi:hypothetical protein